MPARAQVQEYPKEAFDKVTLPVFKALFQYVLVFDMLAHVPAPR